MCQSLCGYLFEEFFVTARQDGYDIMGGLNSYDKRKYKSTCATYFHGGTPLQEDSSENNIIYFLLL